MPPLSPQLADVLAEHMRRSEHTYTPGQLAKRSGIPKATIVNWLEGRARRPRHWQDLVRVAAALRLSEQEAGDLLRAAGQPALAALAATSDDPKDQLLFALWSAGATVSLAAPMRPRLEIIPQPISALISRTQTISAVLAYLRGPQVRLLTLTGPGGIGKTRVALQAALELRDDPSSPFSDGVVFVSLLSAGDAGQIASLIAQSLGIDEAGGRPLLEQIQAFLRDRRLLLALDNFEHVLAAAPLVSALLSAAPGLSVLATSRALLHLSGEQELVIPPLALPDKAQLAAAQADAAVLAAYEAVDLFMARALAVRPDFELNDANAHVVVAICQRLDGLPLAIELAAARLKLFSLQALLTRLERRLALLTGGARDLPAHQQTLRGTIDWSYNLLSPAEQALFAWLAVFNGTSGIEQIEAVCGALAEQQTLDNLASLVNKSLLVQEATPDGEPRFRMLETIREYALERLRAQGDLEIARLRHAQVFLALAELAEKHYGRAEATIWLDRLEHEYGNLQAAIEWAFSDGTPAAVDLAARLSSSLADFWWTRGYIITGHRWLTSALAQSELLAPRLRAKLYGRTGMLAWLQAAYDQAKALCQQSLALYRMCDDASGIGWALRHLGYVAWEQGDPEQAEVMLTESVAYCRASGDTQGVARALHLLGWVAVLKGEERQAIAYYQECLTLSRELGDKQFMGHAVNDLGLAFRRQGDLRQAKELIEQGLLLRRSIGVKGGIAWSLYNRGLVARDQEDYPQAVALFMQSLALRYDMGDQRGIAECLEGVAAIAGRNEQQLRAAQLYGAAASIRDAIGTPLLAFELREYEAQIESLRARLEPVALQDAWEMGQSLTLEEATRLARSV